jgi:hypothetical protein
MCRPPMLSQSEGRCLIGIKNDGTTSVTIGCTNGIISYVREYFDNGSHQISMEWSIISCDTKSSAFSAPGDSSAVIVDKY